MSIDIDWNALLSDGIPLNKFFHYLPAHQPTTITITPTEPSAVNEQESSKPIDSNSPTEMKIFTKKKNASKNTKKPTGKPVRGRVGKKGASKKKPQKTKVKKLVKKKVNKNKKKTIKQKKK